MFIVPFDSKSPLFPLVEILHDATHAAPLARSFDFSPVVRSHAILAHPDTAAMMWEACSQQSVSFDPEQGTLKALGSTLAQSFPTDDGEVRWVLRPPKMGWGEFPLRDKVKPFRSSVNDAPNHMRIAIALLHAVYGYEEDGEPRAAIGYFAGVPAMYTPLGVFELRPGHPIALIPEDTRSGVLAEYSARWERPGAKRRVSRVKGDPAFLRPAPLVRDGEDLDLFLSDELRLPPMRPVQPPRGRGNFSPERKLEWEDTLYRWHVAMDEWEDTYGLRRTRRSKSEKPRKSKRKA